MSENISEENSTSSREQELESLTVITKFKLKDQAVC